MCGATATGCGVLWRRQGKNVYIRKENGAENTNYAVGAQSFNVEDRAYIFEYMLCARIYKINMFKSSAMECEYPNVYVYKNINIYIPIYRIYINEG